MGIAESIEADQAQKVPSVQRILEPQAKCSEQQPCIMPTQDDEKPIDYFDEIKKIKRRILDLPQQTKLFRNHTWEHIFDTFQKLYLNPSEKVEFVDFISDLLEVNFHQTTYDNEVTFCGEMGKSFQNLQNRIYFKHKYCLQNFFFAIKPQNKPSKALDNHFGALSMDLSDEQVQKLTGKVRNLCQNDLNSFSFITLYLIHALKKFLQSNKTFSQVQNLLESVLLKLQKLYPATNNQTNVKQDEITFENLKKVKISQNYDVIKFVKGPKNNYDQLKDFVIEKAKGADKDKQYFYDLIHKICTKKGYGFRYGLKIKDEYHESAIFRTIQKVLDQQKYEEAFLAQKQKIINSSQGFSTKSEMNKMKTFIETQKSDVKKLIINILQKQTEIHFDAKDLLRAKCLYTKPNELIFTVEELLQIFDQKGITLLLFKNRLNKKTKDITLVINLPHSIAELQLALKFDTTSNEFNHKIYELLRSRIYTPLTNLYVQNENWSSAFFVDQFQIFHEIVKNGGLESFDEKITFKEIQNQVIEFKQKFLNNDFLSIAIDSQENSADSITQKLANPLKTLQDIITQSYGQNKSIDRQKRQILNEISFYQKANNYKEAEKLLSQLKQIKDIDSNNSMVIRLKAQLFYEKQDYASAFEFYDQLIHDHEVNQKSQSVEFAYDKMNAGLCCKYLGYFQDALQHLNNSLEIYERLLGKDTFEYSNVLYTLGMTYDDQKNYPLALENYLSCLKIQQDLFGKQSIEVASTIHNMGLIYNTMQKYDESSECYEKCLKIQEYILGKENIKCAITLGNMGVLYDNMKLPQKALQMYERSVFIKQKISGRASIDVAITLNNIAMVYQGQNNYDKASKYYIESMQIKQSIKGKEDIDCAYSYLNVSILYSKMQRYQDAISNAEKSYEIRRNVLGEYHQDTQLSLQWINYEKGLLQNQ